jgi:hypothetical protein
MEFSGKELAHRLRVDEGGTQGEGSQLWKIISRLKHYGSTSISACGPGSLSPTA